MHQTTGRRYPPFSLSIQIFATNKDKLFLLAPWHLVNTTLRPPPRRPPPPSTTPPPPPRAKGSARHGWGCQDLLYTCCTGMKIIETSKSPNLPKDHSISNHLLTCQVGDRSTNQTVGFAGLQIGQLSLLFGARGVVISPAHHIS